MASTVFGPVVSRRLGRSLGIDPVPCKTCNFNCVYCQLGRSRRLTTQREEFTPLATIIDDLRRSLGSAPELDWVTLIGSGETALYSRIGEVIAAVRRETDRPVAVITNGSLLYRDDVRDELLAADAVLPSLDAGSSELFVELGRPHPDCTFTRHVNGLRSFRRSFSGRLWLEVMLVRGINDSVLALETLASVIEQIEPDEVHLGVPTRPPAEPWVEPPDAATVMRATWLLGSTANVIGPANDEVPEAVGRSHDEIVVDIVTRHPMRTQELQSLLPAADVDELLRRMEKVGRVRRIHRLGKEFWTAAASA